MIECPPGFRIGHWHDSTALTGCTVILCPPGTVGGCDVRGSSPGSRELALLASDKSMQQVHAVLLTGGSAFGLSAADGVVRFLEERQIGYETPWARVPIVPAAVIFDLNVGSPAVRPDAGAGYSACLDARVKDIALGSVGAGIGATVGKWAGIEARMRGGFGMAELQHEGLRVLAVAVVNAVGDVFDESGLILAGALASDGRWVGETEPVRRFHFSRTSPLPRTNTTLVAILTNARLSKVDTNRCAQRAHDGMARAIRPVHTSFDGDIAFALASGPEEVSMDLVAELGAEATAQSIRNAVREASALPGLPAVAPDR
jgi:L-aminopeptidase/D-esterase-like protein